MKKVKSIVYSVQKLSHSENQIYAVGRATQGGSSIQIVIDTFLDAKQQYTVNAFGNETGKQHYPVMQFQKGLPESFQNEQTILQGRSINRAIRSVLPNSPGFSTNVDITLLSDMNDISLTVLAINSSSLFLQLCSTIFGCSTQFVTGSTRISSENGSNTIFDTSDMLLFKDQNQSPYFDMFASGTAVNQLTSLECQANEIEENEFLKVLKEGGKVIDFRVAEQKRFLDTVSLPTTDVQVSISKKLSTDSDSDSVETVIEKILRPIAFNSISQGKVKKADRARQQSTYYRNCKEMVEDIREIVNMNENDNEFQELKEELKDIQSIEKAIEKIFHMSVTEFGLGSHPDLEQNTKTNDLNLEIVKLVKKGESELKDLIRNVSLNNRSGIDLTRSSRLDGRSNSSVREIYAATDVLPTLYGSALFSRGESQVLATLSIDSSLEVLPFYNMDNENCSSIDVKYHFPGYSTNHLEKNKTVDRRMVGHGNLIHKGLAFTFPNILKKLGQNISLKIDTKVLSSDGSTSLAGATSASMALYNAGLINADCLVSGVSIGLLGKIEEKEHVLLTDILGMEDHFGLMDFKVTGTLKGITAVQLDIKCKHISLEIVAEALSKAQKGRTEILHKIQKIICKKKQTSLNLKGKYSDKISFNIPNLTKSKFLELKTIERLTQTRILLEKERDELIIFSHFPENMAAARNLLSKLSEKDSLKPIGENTFEF